MKQYVVVSDGKEQNRRNDKMISCSNRFIELIAQAAKPTNLYRAVSMTSAMSH
jgi:hypothetical protein